MSNDKDQERPEYGTPEFDVWIRERSKRRMQEFSKIEMTEEQKDLEVGRLCGSEYIEDLMPEKTIAEDIRIDKEIAEYEKRKHLKVIK